jgi:hypothetical protein
VLPLVRPGGRFGIVTFAAERMETPDDNEIVRTGDSSGGMAFSREDLAAVFGSLDAVEIRPVQPDRDGTFAPDFLNAALFTA